MPLEVMLHTVRTGWAVALKEPDAVKRLELMRAVCQVAKDAAPYCHPKLASIQHVGDRGNPVAFVIYGEREAESTEAWVARHAPAGTDNGGEPTT